MAVNYSTAIKAARLTVVRDAVDAGSGPGRLEIGTSGMATVLAVFTLADPCAAVSGDTLTLSGAPLQTTAVAGGPPAEARFVDSDGNVCVSGLTVGTSGQNIVLSASTITAGQVVRIQSGTIIHG